MTVLYNAILTAIETPGAQDRNGDPQGSTASWTGRAPAYLKRVRRSIISGGAQIRDERDVLILLDSAGAPTTEIAGADWEASVLRVEDQRMAYPVMRTFNVTAAEHRAAGTIADSVRLELDEK